MNDPSRPPFRRASIIIDPRLVGARWWQDALQKPLSAVSRRSLLQWAVVGTGTALVGGAVLAGIARAVSSSGELKTADALAAQQAHGWSLGSEGEAVDFAGAAGGPLPLAQLQTLASDLAPSQPRLVPYYVPTLFQSIAGSPPQPASAQERPLAEVLRQLATPEMAVARERGEALASLFTGAPAGKAAIIDLPGPLAVAFAAGLSATLEPVFLFDNWPHPRGVVPSHLTLAAAATLAPVLRERARQRPSGAAPAFVLDRNRLTPYTDESTLFDNRYLARLPPAQALAGLGILEVLYVTPTAEAAESDDLVDDFVAYAQAGVAVKVVAATDFRPDAEPAAARTPLFPDDPPASSGATATDDATAPVPPVNAVPVAVPVRHYHYGGSPLTHYGFWSLYRWGTPAVAYRQPTNVSQGHLYRPALRPTLFSTGLLGQRTRPSSFAKVSTVVQSGRVVGAHFGRSGSFGRGTWSGS